MENNLSLTKKGTSIIFINENNDILLLLRDDTPMIPYPNMWDLPGGHVEAGESPEKCIVREMKEELGICLKDFNFFSKTFFFDRTEYVFWKKENIDIRKIKLTEGQCLRWFSHEEIKQTELACCFNLVVEEFFKKNPYL